MSVFMKRRELLIENKKIYTINLYRYGSLYKTLEVEEGSSVTLGTCTPAYSDDTFYGWSTSPTSTYRSYTSSSKLTPTANMNLYAIYSYTKTTIVEKVTTTSTSLTSGSSAKSTGNITLKASGTVSASASASGYTVNRGSSKVPYYYLVVNGSSVSGSTSATVGSTIRLEISRTPTYSDLNTTIVGGIKSFTATVNYPTITQTTQTSTAYRVISHTS